MQSKAKTVSQYLKELPPDRRKAISAVREVILDNLPTGYEEGMQYGMIGYYVPHSVYPPGYHCDPKQPLPFASVASQKNHMAVYLMCIYSDTVTENWFRKAWGKTGKKLDMGKSCVRFKKLEDIPLDVIGEAIKRVPVTKFVAFYETSLKNRGTAKPKPKAKTTAKKTGAAGKKKAAKKKTATKKVAKKSSKKPAAKRSKKVAKKR